MSEIASQDAVIAVHPEDSQQFALLHRAGVLPESFVDRLASGEHAETLRLFTRSVLGQMAVGMVASGAPILLGNKKTPDVYSPVEFTQHGDMGEVILYDLDDMRQRTQVGDPLRSGRRRNTIGGGRYVDFSQLKRLDTCAKTKEAFDDWLIAVDVMSSPGAEKDKQRECRINDDGSITMPIALVQTLMSSFMLDTREERLNAIKHGRAGLADSIDTEERQLDDIMPQFVIAGVALSPGPFNCVIREALDAEGKVRHVSGATMLDGNRLMGIGRHLNLYERHLQLELINLATTQSFGATEVTIDIYRDGNGFSGAHPVVDWYNLSIEDRQKLHMNGVSPNDVIHISNPSARDRLKKVYKGTGGIIMSAHGADIVPLGETDKLNANHVLKVAKSFGRNRGISPETEPLRPFVENLGPAGDRSRVYAGERLLPKYFGKLVDGADVRSFFVEDYGDMAMSQQTHSAMVDLARSGVSMSWESPTGPRVFHRSGLWIGREDIARFENLEMIVAMYGTHRKAIDEKLEPKLRLFFEEMTKIVPAYGLGFIHGNGPGLMRMTDVMARAVKAMSVAIGILVEGQDEGDDIWLPQAVAHFMDGSRLYRQQSMDKKRLVTVINPGGDGTIEESGITKCSDKLHQIIPGPTVVVDPPGNYFTGLIQMFAQASERKKIDMWGEEVDITETPFAQPWVTNTVHHVQNYTPPETEEGKVEAYETAKKSSTLDPRSATEIIKEFYETPAKYWEKAKIPEREIAKAFKIHTKELGEMGMHLASRFELAAKEYTA